ncbi:LOW QUALITY PROTEIN: retinol dehydrogenase 12-like [Pollicipes pollicipes]|uniref:LOW QUALITY PROTEIN: retinol dehydrogenase 12-like n=1 Tax=Pollicipes pollicipes TaxID=41117 RepID=UPI001885308E|nr:LOW QUALITY PROTEIN: retinol dehydrogenase 12-like [Pollicipes pollicipes]
MPWNPMYRSEARLDGKTVVITGANSGVGKETARDLGRRGARLILGVRSLERGEAALRELPVGAGGKPLLLQLDLASLESVRCFAAAVRQREPKVHLLINNAGVMACPRAETADGFELQLGTNHLGHFLLTHLLLDQLRAAAPARVINLSSLAHTRGQMHFDDLMLTKGYTKWKAYYQSKLANVLFTRELARRLAGSGVTTYAVHPGVVRTELWRHQGGWLRALLRPVVRSPEQGAQTTLYCALAPELETVSGRYYADCKETQPSRRAQSDEDAARLWAVSERLVGLPAATDPGTQ